MERALDKYRATVHTVVFVQGIFLIVLAMSYLEDTGGFPQPLEALSMNEQEQHLAIRTYFFWTVIGCLGILLVLMCYDLYRVCTINEVQQEEEARNNRRQSSSIQLPRFEVEV